MHKNIYSLYGSKSPSCIFKDLKGTFFALLRTSLPTAKKVPFSRFWEHRFQLQKRDFFCAFHEITWNRKKIYLFCALKHRLVKWEMDEERTILTSKYHSLESWKYLTSFFKKRSCFLIFNLNNSLSIFEVIRWQITIFQMIAGFKKFIWNMSCISAAQLKFWFQTDLGRENSASYYRQGRELLLTLLTIITRWSRSSSNFYAVIGQIWQVSLCRKFMQHLESCLLLKVGIPFSDGIVFVFHLSWCVRGLQSLKRYWPYLISFRAASRMVSLSNYCIWFLFFTFNLMKSSVVYAAI